MSPFVQAEESRVHAVFKKEDYVRAVGSTVCLVLVATCIVIHSLRFIEAKRLKKIWCSLFLPSAYLCASAFCTKCFNCEGMCHSL